MNIAVASTEPFAQGLADAYRKLGHAVTGGREAFFQPDPAIDVLHVFWPEEYLGFAQPTARSVDSIRQSMARWPESSTVVFSVNNATPHGKSSTDLAYDLYRIFVERANLIQHFSNASVSIINSLYPCSADKPCVVTSAIGYQHLVRGNVDREQLRTDLGFSKSDVVIFTMGALREWDEFQLIRDAFRQTRLPTKRLLLVSRYLGSRRSLRGLVRRLRWNLWVKRTKSNAEAVVVTAFVPDEQVHRYAEAADILIVPRLRQLSSGLVGLGMTFGKVVVAPDHGAYPDYLKGTQNLLYKSGDAGSLASAVEQAARMDWQAVSAQNRAIASTWGWDNVATKCLDLVAERRRDSSGEPASAPPP